MGGDSVTGSTTRRHRTHLRRAAWIFCAAVLVAALGGLQFGAARAAGPLGRIEHVIVIYQENRSFDHYFGAYRPPGGGAVAGLLDAAGQVDPRFTGIQKNPAGAPVWSYCADVEVMVVARSGDRANHVLVYGAAAVGGPPIGEAWDWADVADTGQERFLHVIEPQITTRTGAGIRATLE